MGHGKPSCPLRQWALPVGGLAALIVMGCAISGCMKKVAEAATVTSTSQKSTSTTIRRATTTTVLHSVTTTTFPPRPTTTSSAPHPTQPTSTITSTNPPPPTVASHSCSASMSDASPSDYTDDTVNITSNVPNAPVVITKYHRK